jgi:hypothetical protein
MADFMSCPRWPDEVHLDANRLFGYFAEPGMVKEVYADNG